MEINRNQSQELRKLRATYYHCLVQKPKKILADTIEKFCIKKLKKKQTSTSHNKYGFREDKCITDPKLKINIKIKGIRDKIHQSRDLCRIVKMDIENVNDTKWDGIICLFEIGEDKLILHNDHIGLLTKLKNVH